MRLSLFKPAHDLANESIILVNDNRYHLRQPVSGGEALGGKTIS
jgi:hypothetical protein